MKIACQSCAAKYTIADEKVLGKVVKIRCKKCGATIVVNGNEVAGASAAAAPHDYANQGAGGDSWTVNVADGDQRTLTDGEIVSAYHAGVVNDETFCWKDGMNDWLPLREIEQLYAQCTATRAMPSPAAAAGLEMYQGSVVPQPASLAPQPGNGGFTDAAPLAARRTGGRAPVADLFSGAAQAGSEEDVMTSAPAGMPQPHQDDGKLTGARNENSVLFSLNALTSSGPIGGGGGGGGGGGISPSASGMSAGSEASGLIDIRQLSSQMGLGEDKKKKSRIDDIMNLGGGGAFAPSLGAPVLAAPPIEEYAPPPEVAAGGMGAPGLGKNRMLIIGAIVAGLVVIFGAIGVASLLMKGKDETAAEKAAASASAAASAAAMASAAASVAAAATDSAPTPSATDSAPTPSASVAAATTAAPPPAATTSKPVTTSTATTPPAATTAAPPATAAGGGGSDQPFNMGEAKAKLGGIAGGVQSCKRGDASGTGRVVVTFNPATGGATSAVVSGVGFEGTPTGSCVAGRFRGARVPPFSGSPFSVSKSFTIN